MAAQGAAKFWAATAFRPGRSARLVPVRANGQPAFGLCVRDPRAPAAHASGILGLFGLPRTLPG